ncbi:SIR2 family protein [Vibrio fluvialis]|nr:SIR2 family protein [Vibrio fluvialis]
MTNNLLDAPISGSRSGTRDTQLISIEELSKKLLRSSKDIVFFTGAGFSKSWHQDYPTGLSLFSIDFNSIGNTYNFLTLAEKLHIARPSIEVDKKLRKNIEEEQDTLEKFKLELELSEKNYERQCYEFFSNIKYHLDLYKKYPGMLPNFLDKTIIKGIESEIKSFVKKRFCELAKTDKPLDISFSSKGNKNIISFFNEIMSSGSSINFISTNYDFIIEKIFKNLNVTSLDRGVIERKSLEAYDWYKHDVGVYKLNGGFEIFTNKDGYYIDYNKSTNSQAKEIEWDSPCIIIPSQEQDYSDKYFENCFIKSSNRLREASILVFVGYSLPIEDNAIRFMLKNFVDCSNNQLKNKEVYVVSRNAEGSLSILQRVKDLFPRLVRLDEEHAIKALDGGFSELTEYVANASKTT